MNNIDLYRALQIVKNDAKDRERFFIEEQKKCAPRGWSTIKHLEYCQKEIDEASATRHYCFIRMMQLSPD